MSEQLKSHFGDKVFNTVIPATSAWPSAQPAVRRGVHPSSKGAQAFVTRPARTGNGSVVQKQTFHEQPRFDADAPSRVKTPAQRQRPTPAAAWLDGWLVRFCPGKARRARCINAVAGRPALPVAE